MMIAKGEAIVIFQYANSRLILWLVNVRARSTYATFIDLSITKRQPIIRSHHRSGCIRSVITSLDRRPRRCPR